METIRRTTAMTTWMPFTPEPARLARGEFAGGQPLAEDRRSQDADDAALVAAIAAGDAAALDRLYVRYRRVAFVAAYTVLQEPNATEDVIHDAFLNLWRAANSFRPSRGSLRGWLLTIVRNAAIDHLRARQRAAPAATLDHHEEYTPAHGVQDDLATTVAAAADARRLHSALSALPPLQRQAVELAYFGGLSHGEIAAHTGTPLGTVKGRVRLGLRRLRDDLHDLAPATPIPARSPLPAT
jgi:RNA polymerase sigma-70 factor (ECF subfamily)